MTAVQSRLPVCYLIILGHFLIDNLHRIAVRILAGHHSLCLIVIQIIIYKHTHTGIRDLYFAIGIHPALHFLDQPVLIITGIEIIHTDCGRKSIDIFLFHSRLPCVSQRQNRLRHIIRSVDGRFACRLIISSYGIDTDRALIPAAAATGIAHTYRDRVCSAIIQNGGIQIIHTVRLPRIGAVIYTNTFRDRIIHTGGSYILTVDIYLIRLVKIAERQHEIFFRKILRQFKRPDIPGISAVIGISAQRRIKVRGPPAESRLHHAPGLIYIRRNVCNIIKLHNRRIVSRIRLVCLEIPVAHQVNQLFIVRCPGILHTH